MRKECLSIPYKLLKLLKLQFIFVPGRERRSRLRKKLYSKIGINFFKFKKREFEKLNHYDYIYSLGEACFVSQIIELIGLRKTSGPFDWIFGGSFKTRTDIFLDDFNRFFDKSDLKEKPRYSSGYGMTTYENKYNRLFFNHDFEIGKDFDIEYEIVREKYNRRAKRMLDNIKNSKRILLFYAECGEPSEWYPEYHGADLETIKKFLKIANYKYNDKIDLIYFHHNKNMKIGQYRIKKENNNLYYCEYFSLPLGEVGLDPFKTYGVFHTMTKALEFVFIK